MTRTLCSQYIDPSTVEPLLASRLIPLDKGEGATDQTYRCRRGDEKDYGVMNVARDDVIASSGSLQLSTSQQAGNEAAVHAMNAIFEEENTDAVLLIDASNAFNSLNRASALYNIRIVCPVIATYAINTYRRQTRLFITGGKELTSAEGTKQGVPIAMAIYALSAQPLISILQNLSGAKPCWFADDASGIGGID